VKVVGKIRNGFHIFKQLVGLEAGNCHYTFKIWNGMAWEQASFKKVPLSDFWFSPLLPQLSNTREQMVSLGKQP